MDSTMENYETLYKEVCRICLSLDRDNDQMVPLVEENSELTCYGKDIENITQICIENIKAPPNMCQQCLTLLNQTKQFIKKCKSSQAYFENIKNCSEYYRKKIVVDTILSYSKGFNDGTVPIEITNTLNETAKPFMEITETSDTSEIDEKTKEEFKIPLIAEIETKNIIKDFSDSSTLIVPLNIKMESNNDLKLLLNQYKEVYHKAKTKDKSPNEILNFLKSNTNIKIKHISNKSTEKLTTHVPSITTATTLIKKKLIKTSKATVNHFKQDKPVWKFGTPVRKFSTPVRKLSAPDRKSSVPVLKLSIPVLESNEPVRSRKSMMYLEKFKNAEGVYVCNICQKSAKTRSSLRSHFERHARKIVCHYCGKKFATKAEIQLHMGAKHGGERKYKCADCDFKTGVKFELKQHVSVHTGERPYVCEQCGLDFRTQLVLKNHILVHSEKTVQCPKCPLKFRNRSQLSGHDNSVHDRRYMYGCPNCERLYARNKSVRKHLVNFHGVPRNKQGKVPLIKVNEAGVSTTSTSLEPKI